MILFVGDSDYTFVGTGAAGPNEIWNVGNAKGQGVKACYEAVKADQRCAKDYFTYVTRGDKNCGCKGSSDPLSIRQTNNGGDYFKIVGTYTLKNYIMKVNKLGALSFT